MKNKDQTKCSIEAIKLRQTAELNAKYGAAAPILMYHGEHCRRAPAPAPVKAGYELSQIMDKDAREAAVQAQRGLSHEK